MASGAWGLSSRSEYQRQICELELEISRLRSERDDYYCKVAELEAARNYYAECFAGAPVGFVTLDDMGKVLECNDTFLDMVGPGDGKPQERMFVRLLAPGQMQRFLRHLLQAKRCGQPVSCELGLRIAGKTIPVELISRGLNERSHLGAKYVRTIVMDLRKRMQAEDSRAQKQSDFKLLVDTIQGVVWEADADTLEIIYVSPRVEQALGYTANYWSQGVSPRVEQALGYTANYWSQGVSWVSHVYHEDREWVAGAMRDLASNRQDASIEYRMLRGDRRVIWVHNSMSAAFIGKRLRIFGVVIDITDRKLAEEQLRLARDQLEQRVNDRTAELRETVRDLEAFSYSLSHDLRAPLRAMQGYAQLLLNRFGEALDDTGRNYFNRLMSSTERLDRLIQDVLKYSQVARTPVELRAVNLERLLDEVVNDYPVLLPPSVRIDVKKPLLPVRGHEAFLTQCMSNLISNAIKFNRPGQTPRVRISTQEVKRGKVRVWFEDDGIGIAPEDQRRIFGIFERVYSNREYEGTGIGLAIVAKAVERMGGQVGVESAIGQGSRFWLDLQGTASARG